MLISLSLNALNGLFAENEGGSSQGPREATTEEKEHTRTPATAATGADLEGTQHIKAREMSAQ